MHLSLLRPHISVRYSFDQVKYMSLHSSTMVPMGLLWMCNYHSGGLQFHFSVLTAYTNAIYYRLRSMSLIKAMEHSTPININIAWKALPASFLNYLFRVYFLFQVFFILRLPNENLVLAAAFIDWKKEKGNRGSACLSYSSTAEAIMGGVVYWSKNSPEKTVEGMGVWQKAWLHTKWRAVILLVHQADQIIILLSSTEQKVN